jgi:hypothetical protein
MFVTTAPFAEKIGRSWREDRVHAELVHEPPFLGEGIVAAAGHRARMADRTRQLGPSSGRPRTRRSAC